MLYFQLNSFITAILLNIIDLYLSVPLSVTWSWLRDIRSHVFGSLSHTILYWSGWNFIWCWRNKKWSFLYCMRVRIILWSRNMTAFLIALLILADNMHCISQGQICLDSCACCHTENLLLLFLRSQLYLWGSPFLVSFLCIWPFFFFNPTIKVVAFRLHLWCMLGMFL